MTPGDATTDLDRAAATVAVKQEVSVDAELAAAVDKVKIGAPTAADEAGHQGKGASSTPCT